MKLTVAGYVGALHEALESVHKQIRDGLTIEYDRKVREREKAGVKSLDMRVGTPFPQTGEKDSGARRRRIRPSDCCQEVPPSYMR